MSKYIGKVCPYCKTPFTEDDEVVVCSACEMPHHKECWIENHGCTTFGCQGTIQGADPNANLFPNGAPGAVQPAFCAHCGSPVAPGAAFCAHCGTPVAAPQASGAMIPGQPTYPSPPGFVPRNDNFADVQLDPELEQYIGANKEHYTGVFTTLKGQKKIASWNWSAFLVAPFWCFYRKLYFTGAIALGLQLLCILYTGFIGSLFALGVSIVAGIFANAIYLFDIEQRAKKGKDLPEPQKSLYVQKWGGTNATVAAITAVSFGLTCIILML